MSLFLILLLVFFYIAGWSALRVAIMEDPTMNWNDPEDRQALFWCPLIWPLVGLLVIPNAISGRKL